MGGEGEALKRLQRFALEVPGQVANQAKAFSGSKSEVTACMVPIFLARFHLGWPWAVSLLAACLRI